MAAPPITEALTRTSIHGHRGEQIRRINDKVTTSDIADAAITAPKLSSDLTLPGTPQVGTPSGLNSPSQTIATIGNVNAAVDAVQIGGTNIYRDTLGTSDFLSFGHE